MTRLTDQDEFGSQTNVPFILHNAFEEENIENIHLLFNGAIEK